MTRSRAAVIALLTLFASAGATALVLTSGRNEEKLVTLLLAVPVGIAFVGGGVLAWWRRPENRTGLLMVLTGLLWYIGALGESDDSLLWTLSNAFGVLPYVVLLHLVLAYPTGRLESRGTRWLVIFAYASLSIDLLGLLFDDMREGCADCPENAFLIEHVDALATARVVCITALSVGILIATVAILVRRWRRATPALRRTLTPVYLSAGALFALLLVAFTVGQISDTVADLLWVVLFLGLLAVPLSFLAGLLRMRLARVGAARLLLETPDEPTLEEAQEGIRRALGDPTLTLAYWDEDGGTYVDPEGKPVELPADTDSSVTTKIEYEGRPLAALLHDAALRTDQPGLLEDVVAAARVALEKDRTLRALRATEQRSRALLAAIPDNMFRVGRDGSYLDANIKDERYLPVPADQLPDRNVREILPPAIADLVIGAVERALDTGEPQTIEYRLQRPVGLRDSEARVVGSGRDEAVIIVRDITDRKRQETALERERDFIRTVVNSAPGFFVVLDLDGALVRFNDTLATTSGHPDDERARGRPFWELFVAPEEADGWREAFERAVADGPRLDLETPLVTTSGERRYVLWRSTPIVDENGDRKQLVTGDDVTERHHHGAELERQRNFLNAIANNAPSLLCLIDEKGIMAERASNIAFERTLQYDPSDTGGDVFWEKYVHPDDADEVRERIERVVAGETLGDHDNRWVTSNGRSLVIAWSCTSLPQIDERRLFLVSGTDVTERKRQELELERQRDFLGALGDASPSLLVVIGPDGRVGRDGVNLTARRLTGYDEEEVDGRLFWDVFPPPDEAERVRGLIEEAIATGQAHEYETHWVSQSGERRLVAWSCTKMPERERRLHRDDEELGPDGPAVPYLIAGSDITERARQRDALRRERDFLSMVANATPAFLCIVDAEGRITEDGVNRAFGEKTGYGDTDARGRIFANLVVAPDDREEVSRALADVVAGGTSVQHESSWETRSGERILVEWTAIPLEQARENQFLIAAVDVTERKRQEQELRRSRARLVEAGDLERRRLERNLHDGAQQRLVSLSLSLRLAQSKLRTDPLAAGSILEGASSELAHALEELRELARGIHPAVLSDRGLGPALESLADRSQLPVELETVPDERLPGPVEAAAFYVVSEALTNVAKYAHASSVRVRVEQLNGYARVEVADDGVGGADPAGGSGLRGLADRVSALDGRLEIASPPGEGTSIRAEIPVES
jgi:PAS domain S-box-containing protein